MKNVEHVSGGARAFGMRRGDGAHAASSPLAPILIDLPMPPSVNQMKKVTRGRMADSKFAAEWKSQVAWRLRVQFGPAENRRVVVPGDVIVIIGVERASARADIDNLTKALLDALVRAKIIVDDSRVLGVATAWNPPGERMARLAVMRAQNLSLDFHLAGDGRHGGWFLSAPTNGEALHGNQSFEP